MSNSTYFLLLFNESAIIMEKGNWGDVNESRISSSCCVRFVVTQMNKFASRKLKPYGIKFNELNIIRFIEKADGPVYQKTICQEFQLSHSTVVGIVFRLDDLGYLLIGNSRVDKRHTNVTITEKGKQLIQETEDIYQEIIGKMKVIISDEEMNTIIQSVDQIKELFK